MFFLVFPEKKFKSVKYFDTFTHFAHGLHKVEGQNNNLTNTITDYWNNGFHYLDSKGTRREAHAF